MLWYLIVAVDFFVFSALISQLRNITTRGFSPALSKAGVCVLLVASLLFFIPLSILYFKFYPVSKPLHLIITLLLWLFSTQGVCLLAGSSKMFLSRKQEGVVRNTRLPLMLFPLLIIVAYWMVTQVLQQRSLLNGWSLLLMGSIIGASLLLWMILMKWLYKLADKTVEGEK